MSDDLISREEVLKLLYEIKDDNSIPKNYGTILDIIREVRRIPIAFDKEKVMNEIKEYKEDSEEWSKKSIENADEFYTYIDAYKRCLEIVEKGGGWMRLIDESDVIKIVDKHTTDDGKLDDDISVILEEVKTAFDKKKVIEELHKREENSIDNHEWNFGGELLDLCIIHEHHGENRAYKHAIEIIEKGGIE